MRFDSSLKLFALLAVLAVVGNLVNITLYSTISVLFGSIFAILALKLLGLGWGVAVAAIGASVTIFLWGHAYAAAIFTLEVLFVGLLTRRTDHLVLVDALFWLLLGFGLVLVTYTLGLGMSLETAAFIGLKQALNGVFNAVVAGLALTAARVILPKVFARLPPVTLSSLLFHTVAFVTILSAAVLVVAESRAQYSQLQHRLSRVMETIGAWTAAQLARNPAPEELQRTLVNEMGALLSFRYGTIDADGEIAIVTLDARGQARDIIGRSVSFGTGGRIIEREDDLDQWVPDAPMAEMRRTRESRFILDLPVPEAGEIRSLRVEFSASPVIDMLEVVGRRNLLLLSATAVLSLALAYGLIAWLTAPIARLATTSSGLSDAILAKRPLHDLAPTAIAEFDALGTALGTMSRSLANAFGEVSDLTHTLEERVRDRTAQLDLMSQVARQTDTVVVITDGCGRVTWVNEAFEGLTGYRLEEVAGKIPGHVLQKVLPPPELTEHMRDCLARGEGFHVELLNQAKDGRSYWVEIRCSPLYDANGNVTGYIAIEADVSERLDNRLKLESSLAQLNLATEVGQLGVWGYDHQSGRIEWNDRNYDLHGISRAVSGDLLADLSAMVDPSDRARIRAILTGEVAQQGESFEFEYLIRHPERGSRVMSTRARCMIEGGQVVRIIGVTRDVTEERRASEELRRTAQHTQAILDNVMDSIVAIDSRGVITSCNRATERIFGYAANEIVGRDISVLMTSDHARRHGGFINAYLGSGQRKIMGRISQFTAVRRDGDEFPIELAVSEIVDGDQRFFIGIIRDVTERMQLEARLRQAQKLEAVGQLTGGIAHDFNNLLSVILGSSEILVDELADRDDLRSMANMIATTAERGAQLTRRLLAFARRQPLMPQQVDINTLITDMEPLLRRAIGGNISVTTHPSEDLWIAEIDIGQLEAAVLNLAINARDAMPEGGRLTIDTANVVLDGTAPILGETVQPGNYVLLKVSDTGCGMPPEVAERAFEPFFTTKDVGKGTGLGLSTVFGFVKQSGGYTDLHSEPGKGTQVRLYFPQAERAAHPADTKAQDSAPPSGSETILVVEDDPQVRSYVTNMLETLGYRVIAAEDGASAVAVLEGRSDIDLLFTDMVMPGGMTGKDVADRARRIHPGIKVLFTSGYTETFMGNDEQRDGDVALLTKPYRRSVLAEKLRAVLGEPDQVAPRG